jgi:hypothetical protein
MFLRELFEAPKTAVFAFGRMNPPTIGHAKLADVVKSQKGDPFLFLSQTQKPKTDPLPFPEKMYFASKSFPGVEVGDPKVKTIIQAMQSLEAKGYTDIIYVAGSDRVDSFTKLLNDYNGKDYKFNSINIVSAGERDPDAEGAEGMSASKMRAAAQEGDFDSFKQGVANAQMAQQMYDQVRKGMGVAQDENVKEWVAPALSALKYGKHAVKIAKWLYNNKWAITFFVGLWKVGGWVADAMAWAKRFLDHPVTKALGTYGLPAVGIAVALYGGRKLYMQLVDMEKKGLSQEEMEKELTEFKPDTSEADAFEKELEAFNDKYFATESLDEYSVKQQRPKLDVLNNIADRKDSKPFPLSYKDTGGASSGGEVLITPQEAKKFIKFYDSRAEDEQELMQKALKSVNGIKNLFNNLNINVSIKVPNNTDISTQDPLDKLRTNLAKEAQNSNLEQDLIDMYKGDGEAGLAMYMVDYLNFTEKEVSQAFRKAGGDIYKMISNVAAMKSEGEKIPNPKDTFLTKSDTAYDFLRVGKTISNLDAVKKGANRDEPDVMIVPLGGKKEKEHLKKGLNRVGYKTQDADKPGDDAHVDENFADGKKKGKSRPGRVKKSGASCNGTVTQLRKRAKNASGEKAKMYHWCANMKSGKKK